MLRNNVQCVTFPRSGHHLLVQLLARYYSGDPALETPWGEEADQACRQVSRSGAFGYCEFYNHCRRTPCPDPAINLQKNHDFDLRLENSPSRYYIIQFRHPLESLVSFYKFMVRKGKINQDTFENWLNFLGFKSAWSRRWAKTPSLMRWTPAWGRLPKRLRYWQGFVTKWILANDNLNTYLLSYPKLLASPEQAIRGVLEFMDPQGCVDEDLLARTVRSVDIRPKNDIIEFRYFDRRLFERLERGVSRELEALRRRGFPLGAL